MYKHILLFFCALSTGANTPHITVQPLAQPATTPLNKSAPALSTEATLNNLSTAFVTNTSPGQPAEVMVQGLPANQTTVMIDGITLNTPLSGSFDVSALLNGSAQGNLLYANNIDVPGAPTGAVLALQTTQPQENETINWNGEGGTPTQAYTYFQVGNKTATSGFLAMMETLTTQGLPQRTQYPRFGEKNPYTTNTFSFTGHRVLGHDWVIDGRFRHFTQQLNTRLDADLSSTPKDRINGTLDIGRLKLSHITPDTQQSFMVGGLNQTTQYIYNNTTPLTHRHQRFEGIYDFTTSFQEHTKSHITLKTSYAQLGKNNAYTYIGHIFHEISSLKNWVFNAAIDIVHQNHFGPKVRLGLSTKHMFNDHTSLTVTYKNGVRYPTLYDLFGMGGLSGNKNLKPETSHTASICLAHQQQGVTLSMTPFATEIHNMIFGVRTAPHQYQRQNQHMSVLGLDTHIKWQTDTWLCKIGYAIAQTNPPKGQPHTYPKHKLTLQKKWCISKKIAWQSTLVFVGTREGVCFDGATRKIIPLKSYVLLSSHLKYTLSDNTSIYIRGENLLNTNYENVPGWGTRGRSIYAGFRMRF